MIGRAAKEAQAACVQSIGPLTDNGAAVKRLRKGVGFFAAAFEHNDPRRLSGQALGNRNAGRAAANDHQVSFEASPRLDVHGRNDQTIPLESACRLGSRKKTSTRKLYPQTNRNQPGDGNGPALRVNATCRAYR